MTISGTIYDRYMCLLILSNWIKIKKIFMNNKNATNFRNFYAKYIAQLEINLIIL